ncbi:wax ester/triacylglycerol synthase domain-containing protein [Saccharothrix lopnurensis]|uniref:diacylglycerol O-acyltransferase n=1 Tax=Saccharothrix lopnurensis TaxID=1670621 RepID=A0ABW1PBZ5_9PSEU
MRHGERRAPSAAERSFLAFDSPRTAQHFGVVCRFEPSGSPEGFARRLVDRLRAAGPVVAPFTSRPRRGVLPARTGGWETTPDAAVDRGHHVRLTRPGGTPADAVARVHSTPLDPARPLWEAHVIPGGREVVLLFKVHHALTDGHGFLARLDRMLGERRDDEGGGPPWVFADPAPAGPAPRPPPLWRAGPLAARTLVDAVRGGPVPYGVPATLLNGSIGPERLVESRVLPLAAVRGVASATGATVNEVYLAVLGGALRSYLLDHAALPRFDLTAGVPVSLRATGDTAAANTFTMTVMGLGTAVADPVARLDAVRAGSGAAKGALARLPRPVLARLAAVVTGPLAAAHAVGAGHLLPRPPYSVVASNVRGPDGPRYLLGERLRSLHGAGSLCHGTGLFAAAVSADDRFEVCLTAAANLVPDLRGLADAVPAEFDALAAAAVA